MLLDFADDILLFLAGTRTGLALLGFEAAFNRDERLPYWADVWPSSIALARAVRAMDGKVSSPSPPIQARAGPDGTPHFESSCPLTLAPPS